CYGSCNGSASVEVSGGTQFDNGNAYAIVWSGIDANGQFSIDGLCVGTFCYTVSDANGCSKVGCITINQPDSLTVTPHHNDVTCYGSCNGTASVTVTGGTGDKSIVWANSNATSFGREGLCVGTYCYTVYDANQCSKAGCITINQPDSLTVTPGHNDVTC